MPGSRRNRQQHALLPQPAYPRRCPYPDSRDDRQWQNMKLEEVNTRTKEAVDFLVAALESGHSEVLTAYLGAMAKFHTYSFGNIMLIARQKPDASNVAGLRTWNSLGRFVKRGEKGIFILAPMVGRRSTKDVATDEPSQDATTEGQRTLYGFRAVYVFDKVCRLVETKHFNPGMNGVDWNALVRDRRDQILACTDPAVFEKEVQDLKS